MTNKINNTIKENRERASISQQGLARELGLKSNNRISRWENGLAHPGTVNLIKIAKKLNVKPEDLYPDY